MDAQSQLRPKVRVSFLLSIGAIATAVLLVGLTWIQSGRPPRATWRVGPPDAVSATTLPHTVQAFESVHVWDRMAVTVDLPFDGYVYVVSFDHFHGAVTHFPTTFLGTDHFDPKTERMNFLRAGTHTIPGTWDAKPVHWFVPNVQESFSLCVVASKTPLPDLEKVLTKTRQVGNRVFPDRSMVPFMPRVGRDQRVGKTKMPHPILEEALHLDHVATADAWMRVSKTPGVYLQTLHLVPKQARPGTVPPGNPVLQQLKKQMSGQKPATPGKGG